MYNIPGLTKTLQLSSYSACAILTGGISNWDNPDDSQGQPWRVAAQSDDPAGDRERLRRHQLRSGGVVYQRAAGSLGCVRQLRRITNPGVRRRRGHQYHAPNSNWPGLPGGLDQQSTSGVAGNIATNPGAIGAVQVKYATDLGFGPNNPAKGVASVFNASGKYTQPDPGGCGVGPGVRDATRQRHSPAELQWGRSERLQPVDLQLSAHKDHGLGSCQGGDAQWVRQLRVDARSGGFTQVRLRISRTLARAVSASRLYWPMSLVLLQSTAAETRATRVATSRRVRSRPGRRPRPVASSWPPPLYLGQTEVTPPAFGPTGLRAAGATAGACRFRRGSGGSTAPGGRGSGRVTVGRTGLAFTGGDPLPLVVLGVVLVGGAWLVRRRSATSGISVSTDQ